MHKQIYNNVLAYLDNAIQKGRTQKNTDKEEAVKIAESVGLRLNDRKPAPHSWNGYDLAMIGKKAGDVLHEVAHFQLSSPLRRSFPDFGLGSGFDSQESTYVYVPQSEANDEEAAASILGILWLARMGINPFPFLEEQNWIWNADKDDWKERIDDKQSFRKSIIKLFRYGLIKETGEPTYYCRTTKDRKFITPTVHWGNGTQSWRT